MLQRSSQAEQSVTPPLLTSCSSWTAALALKSNPAAKTHTYTHTQLDTQECLCAATSLYMLPLFWILIVCVSVCVCVCVRERERTCRLEYMHVCQTDSFIENTHFSRTSSPVRWGAMTQTEMSLFFFLPLAQQNRSTSPRWVYLPVHLTVKVINSDSDLHGCCNISDYKELGRQLVDLLWT